MISIRIENLGKRFGPVPALAGVNLEIAPGELFFLLGPSGCGKTTLLRTLAGFYFPDEGRVFFGDEDVSRLAPHKRNTGMMFQSYALWPHMTVAENVAFGLEERRIPRAEIGRRVKEALESVRMGEHGARRPNQLSGGQQQRVALARAMVIRPRCLLLDEPLSNLDARLRHEMRGEIRRVCKEFRLTTVYVTHDQKEALSVSDRMAVLGSGRVLQVGTPGQVYRRPSCRTVADFIGETNFLAGRIRALEEGGRVRVETAAGPFLAVLGDPEAGAAVGAEVVLSVRPECWRLSAESGAGNAVRGRIDSCVYGGETVQYEFIVAGVVDPGPASARPATKATLKILELNPRSERAERGELFARAEPEDVVALLR